VFTYEHVDDLKDTYSLSNMGMLTLFPVYFFSPQFLIDLIFYVLLIVLYTYVLLDDLGSGQSAWELLLWVWMFSRLVDELMQLETIGVLVWASNVKNWLDTLVYFVFILAFGARLLNTDDHGIVTAKGWYTVDLILIVLRSLDFFAVSPNLGPKLVILGKMVGDLLSFLAFYVVMLFSYGVAAQAILFPDQGWDRNTFSGIIYRPFFQLFGDLMLGIFGYLLGGMHGVAICFFYIVD